MATPRMSTDEEIDALDAVCQRLAGFEDDLSLEWLDGYLTGLLAGPRRIPCEEWIQKMGQGVFARAYEIGRAHV